MTDKDIIKALELCTNDELEVCDGCAFQKYKMGYDGGCLDYLLKSVFDLINRQQAEIERLKVDAKRVDKDLEELDRPLTEIRTEAIKEYIDKLLINLEYNYHLCSQELITLIKDTEKEMVGEQE